MTFYQWLVGQARRDDPASDFALDAIRDEASPKDSSNFCDWYNHLQSLRACPDVIRTLCDVWREYEEDIRRIEQRFIDRGQFPEGVYFILDSGSNRVKIGYSKRIYARFKSLCTAASSSLILLGYIPGDRNSEQGLHKTFATFRARGEWFEYAPQLADFISKEAVMVKITSDAS